MIWFENQLGGQNKATDQVLGALRRLASDERGVSSVFSIVLITTFVALGSLVGLGAVRDHVVQEFGDIAVALDNVDQSFSATVLVHAGPEGEAMICYEAFYVDNPATLIDPDGGAPACLNLNIPHEGELDGLFKGPEGILP